jgi:hypothetical protein
LKDHDVSTEKRNPKRTRRNSDEKGGRPRVALFRSARDADAWIERELRPWYARAFGRAFTIIDAARLGPTPEAHAIADADKQAHRILVKLLAVAEDGRRAIDALDPSLDGGPSTNMLGRVIARIGLPPPASQRHARAMYPIAFAPLDLLVRTLDLEATDAPPAAADVAKIALLAGHRPGGWPSCAKHMKPGELVDRMASDVRDSRKRFEAERAWNDAEIARMKDPGNAKR